MDVHAQQLAVTGQEVQQPAGRFWRTEEHLKNASHFGEDEDDKEPRNGQQDNQFDEREGQGFLHAGPNADASLNALGQRRQHDGQLPACFGGAHGRYDVRRQEPAGVAFEGVGQGYAGLDVLGQRQQDSRRLATLEAFAFRGAAQRQCQRQFVLHGATERACDHVRDGQPAMNSLDFFQGQETVEDVGEGVAHVITP
ncbi:MAG: hypothetical protein A3K19_04790 [Lentisphaerae bacterium RIFOXYB12_FULL_65_16]|nr:MAG: hypothetical protein A3K19_04790 [Lentisphaerae bacterium RIFOXYB12_FULL_65_16]